MKIAMVLLLCCANYASAVTVKLAAGQQECFHETLGSDALSPEKENESVDVRVGISVRKPSSNRRPRIRAAVTEPDGARVWEKERLRTDEEAIFPAQGMGSYSLCFTNTEVGLDAGITLIDVDYFMPHHQMPDQSRRQVRGPSGSLTSREKTAADSELIEEAQAYASRIIDDIKLLKQEQSHLVKRQQRHLSTLHSNRRRTLLWTGIEAVGICIAAGAQVMLLRRYFTSNS